MAEEKNNGGGGGGFHSGARKGSSGSSPDPENGCSNANGSGWSSNKEQDRFLPIANVGRIMKKAIPGNGKVSKDAKEIVQECVSEFISFITGEASDKCQREKRKTINGDDLIWAITTLGFDNYVHPLKLYLLRYREMEGEKLSGPTQQQQTQPQPPQQQLGEPLSSETTSSHLMYAHQPPFSMPFQQYNDLARGQW